VVFVLLSFLCICNFLSAIKYLSFCFVIPVYLYHILLMIGLVLLCLMPLSIFKLYRGGPGENYRHAASH
jgi:hypothetical protein